MIHTLNKRRAPMVIKRPPASTELARQQDGFTAEGSPPPGRVFDGVPVTQEAPQAAPPAPATDIGPQRPQS